MIKTILMDIEGTTTSIDFVHETLFPYATKNLSDYVNKNHGDREVGRYLEMCRETITKEMVIPSPSLDLVISSLMNWIKEDRKHTGLKGIQGLLWRDGYQTGAYVGHIYDDVLPSLLKWQDLGIKLAIYSSGSVQAQRLLFQHSVRGDLTPLLSNYFDTTIGAKRDPQSYRRILAILACQSSEVLFLSDVKEELDAASSAGLKTTQLVRPGTKRCSGHATCEEFSQIVL